MREYGRLLDERGREIDAHLTLVSRLEASAAGRGTGLGVPIETEPVNILKSGLIVHLYNVVEAVMTKVAEEVVIAARVHRPREWCDGLLREWSRGRLNLRRDITIDTAEKRVFDLLVEAVDHRDVGLMSIGREAGNWSNKEIEKLASRLSCDLAIDPDIRRAACDDPFVDDFAPMRFLRHKRNRLAHGNESFVEGARSLTADRLGELRDPVMAYMDAVASSFDLYLDGKRFLR